MKYKVLIPQNITEVGRKYLEENDCELIILDDPSKENICKSVVDCDAILARTVEFGAEVFNCGKKLKVIAKHGVGYDNIDLKAAAKHNVKVCYTPQANAQSVAEHTLTLILACAKKLVLMDKLTKINKWNLRDTIKPVNISGKTLGIIGFGKIGSLVAKKAALGFDMNVLVLRHHPGKGDLPDYVKECYDLDEIFQKSDFISLHAPLTNETTNLVNTKRLNMMKPTAYIINTSRGAEVDEDALYNALKEGTIAGAGLDVFVKEPAINNKLFELDNVIVSPHNAAHTIESMNNMGLQAAIGIIEVLNGKEPTWPVKY